MNVAKPDRCRLRTEVEGAGYLLVSFPADKGDGVSLCREKLDLTLAQRRMRSPEREKAPVVLQQGSFIALLLAHCHCEVFRWHGQPGFRSGEPAIRGAPVPDHWRAAAVAALEFRPEAHAIRVLKVLEGNVCLVQSKLLALIDAHRAAQRHEERRQHLEIGGAVGLAGAPTGGVTHDIVVGEGPAGPPVGCHLAERFKHRTNLGSADLFRAKEVEGVAHLHALIAGRIGGNDLKPALRIADFANRCRCRIFVEKGAKPLQELQILRLALVVEVVLIIVRIDRRRDGIVALALRQRRIVL